MKRTAKLVSELVVAVILVWVLTTAVFSMVGCEYLSDDNRDATAQQLLDIAQRTNDEIDELDRKLSELRELQAIPQTSPEAAKVIGGLINSTQAAIADSRQVREAVLGAIRTISDEAVQADGSIDEAKLVQAIGAGAASVFPQAAPAILGVTALVGGVLNLLGRRAGAAKQAEKIRPVVEGAADAIRAVEKFRKAVDQETLDEFNVIVKANSNRNADRVVDAVRGKRFDPVVERLLAGEVP